MTDGWQDELTRLARAIGSRVEDGARRILRELGAKDPYTVVLYRGHGTSDRLLVRGRVLEDEGITPTGDADSTWRNLLNTYKRLESDPLPHARVRLRAGSSLTEVTADDEGFFSGWIETAGSLPSDRLWHPVTAELIAETPGDATGVEGHGFSLVPPASAAFGLISDIDDTVVQSHVTSLLRAARTLLLDNARTRLPFPGVAAFYQALHAGTDGAPRNPIYYVSSSPWNLHDLLEEFLELQGIPAGPLMLRDWDFSGRILGGGGHHTHKGALIRQLMLLHPTLPFILIGDSGQQDPEIYRDIVHDHPGRILAVYIRNVTRGSDREAAIRMLADEIVAARSSLVLADDTLAAAEHAARHGWILESALPFIIADKRDDEGVTTAKAPVDGTPTSGTPEPPVIIDG